MRCKCSKAVLLSALMITVLLLPLMTVSLITTAEPTVGSLAPLYIDTDGYHVILHGKDTMYQEYNAATPPPELTYSPGDNPPIMVGKKDIGSGRVVAFGGIGTFRGGFGYYGGNRGYPDNVRWKEGELDVLMDNVFQWLKPGATKVLWYDGYGVYHDHLVCEYFIDNMVAAPYNYTITADNTEPIADINLATYDIVVIPQLQLGAGATGGDPSQLPDTDVEAIENFVKDGGGLLIMEGSDYATYNFYQVQNKILKKLGFTYRFQSDSLEDNVNYRQEYGAPPGTSVYLPVVDVNTSTDVGSAYLNRTGENEVGLYAVASLRRLIEWGVTMSVKERYQDCLPGASVTFEVTVNNASDINTDNFDLTVSDDAGWCSTDNLDVNPLVSVENGTSATATLTVKVPDDAPYRMKDNITITATSQGNNTKSDNSATSVYVSTWIAPPTDDAGAVQGDQKANSPQGAKPYMYVGSGDAGTKYQNERGYLQFDLSDGLPAGYTIENARLYLYCFVTDGPLGENIVVYGLDNDDWREVDLTWNNQPGGALTLLDTVSVAENYAWHSWDVKSFVENEFAGDKKASFLVRAETEGASSPDNFSYGFDTEEYDGITQHPYIVFGVRPVASYITENSGLPGENVTVNAVIRNRGAVVDTYDVDIASQSGWTVNPSATVLSNVSPGENRVVAITVTIPGTAKGGTWENLIVTATSDVDDNYASSTTEYGVFVQISINTVVGWNMVGFVEENTPNNLFAGLDYYTDYFIYYWNAPGGPYGLQGPDTVVEDNMGYWVYMANENRLVRQSAIPPDSRNVYLENGWNLVSFPVVNGTTTPNNIFTGLTYYVDYFIYYWNAPGGPYGLQGPDTVLEDNRGYWVWINRDNMVTVP